jgi:cobaltochelatase CobN
MVTMERYLNVNLQARYFNSKWIEGMQESGYAGGRMFSEFVENLFGWQVTNPDLVRDHNWERVYEIYANNPHMKEWFDQNNPHAYQSINARMLETIRKDYWDASSEIHQTLMKNYVESVVEKGVSCCHHTCGNPTLNNYVIEGLMSVPGVVSDQDLAKFIERIEEATKKQLTSPTTEQTSRSSSSGKSSATVTSAESGNQTQDSGMGYGADLQEPAQDALESRPDNYVEGYEMNSESPAEPETGGGFSGSDIVATILVIAGLGAIYIGFVRKKQF